MRIPSKYHGQRLSPAVMIVWSLRARNGKGDRCSDFTVVSSRSRNENTHEGATHRRRLTSINVLPAFPLGLALFSECTRSLAQIFAAEHRGYGWISILILEGCFY